MSTIADVQHSALTLLQRREHSVMELRRKLLQREFAADHVDAVLQSLREQGLQSDARYAECYLRSRAEKGYGPMRIRQELRQRGVNEDLIGQTLAVAEYDWSEQARKVLAKKFGQPAEDFAEKAKQLKFLQYRGFAT